MIEEAQEAVEIREGVRQFILERFIYEDDGADRLRDETALLDEGILDSFGVHELIRHLEETYGFKVEDREATAGNLGSVGGIVAFVSAKRAAA
jgi:acyl carrier protein